MGFRFNRRIKIGGGLGLNVGKRGVSWSVRTKAGSFGSKGYSIRTGIKGLTYQNRYKKTGVKYSMNYSTQHYSNIHSKDVFSGTALFIGFIILLYFFNIPLAFLFSLAFIVIKFLKYSDKQKIASNSATNKPLEDVDLSDTLRPTIKGNVNNLAISQEKDETVDVNLLSNSQLITLENICVSFFDLINLLIIEKNKNPDLFKLHANEEIKLLILHDICNIFHLLEVSTYNNSMERGLWYSTVFYFTNSSVTYTVIDEKEIKKTIQYLVAPDFYVHSDIEKFPFTALIYLKDKDDEFYNSYKRTLNEFVNLITTIDFDLNTKDKKLLQIMHRI